MYIQAIIHGELLFGIFKQVASKYKQPFVLKSLASVSESCVVSLIPFNLESKLLFSVFYERRVKYEN